MYPGKHPKYQRKVMTHGCLYVGQGNSGVLVGALVNCGSIGEKEEIWERKGVWWLVPDESDGKVTSFIKQTRLLPSTCIFTRFLYDGFRC